MDKKIIKIRENSSAKAEEIISALKSLASPKNVEGMARFGISAKNTLGVSMPEIRSMAKKIGKNHRLALKVWDSCIHEARILASLIDIPSEVTEKQMDKWVSGFDSWDVCDQVCMNLFSRVEIAHKKTFDWSKNKKEFIKRAGFALMATLAVHDKKSPDKVFEKYYSVIKRESRDERNYVRKAVNWALRQIGKKNKNLRKSAIKAAKEILETNNKTAKWIASDALRELRD